MSGHRTESSMISHRSDYMYQTNMNAPIRAWMCPRLSAFVLLFSCLGLASSVTLALQGSLQSLNYNGRRTATTLFSAPSGPKAAGRRRTSRSSLSNSTGPRSDRRSARRRERPASAPAMFDAKTLTSAQDPRETTATPLDLTSVIGGPDSTLRCMTESRWTETPLVSTQSPPFEFLSLDDLFGSELGLSARFSSDENFRDELRMAIRQDIFDTTPFYANLSEKAASVLLLPDSSLEGSWRTPPRHNDNGDHDDRSDDVRMKLTTQVLQHAFASKLETDNGLKVPTGDELMHAIGSLCGLKPSTHWIDIYGVQDRSIPHSWHQDFGRSPENSMTVLWGFPPESNYEGCGVFTHLVPLVRECLAPTTHPREPVLFAGKIDEQHIIRPSFGPGRELLRYRDIDVLHSAPDVTYRASVMRFM